MHTNIRLYPRSSSLETQQTAETTACVTVEHNRRSSQRDTQHIAVFSLYDEFILTNINVRCMADSKHFSFQIIVCAFSAFEMIILSMRYLEYQNQNQNVNVLRAIKNRQEVSFVYCTNQTKRLMEKTKKKTIEQ